MNYRTFRDEEGEYHTFTGSLLGYVTDNLLEPGEDAYEFEGQVDFFIGDHYCRSMIFQEVVSALCES